MSIYSRSGSIPLALLLLPLCASLCLPMGRSLGAQETGPGPQGARSEIREEIRTILTYPFSEPDPVPILVRDPRLYPYHAFEGYTDTPEARDWTVVTLENEYVQLFILPEAGGKVWGAVVKETGHEFIYRNEVLKFRNIALRGPWTSGGIEFNFGVIGHTPSTATPVDYRLLENDDGSVSCVVGAMDLPSRTQWRVEIRLPPDRAYFETRVLWYNPTSQEQPYYNWMTGAAFARDDLEMSMPGDAYLQHSGQVEPWPVDEEGRYLALYRNNRFGGHKSYHVVGELHDFFGGYYHDADFGFGHWAPYEDMPGQKLWLWALSREGGVWEELLTDTDGQYVEFQAGRLFVQYSPGAPVNPITQATFHPHTASGWSETWFPLEELGGLTEASREGAMRAGLEGNVLTVSVEAFGETRDTLTVWSGGEEVHAEALELGVLVPVTTRVEVDPKKVTRVELRGLGLSWSSDPGENRLSRPFRTDPEAWTRIPAADRAVFQAREEMRARRYRPAREAYAEALRTEPWHREALLGLAGLEYRAARYEEGLSLVRQVLQLDAYDPEANFLAGLLYRSLGMTADARDAMGWAARSPAYRVGAYLELAELMIRDSHWTEALRYAHLALDFDRRNPVAWRILAVGGRKTGDGALARNAREELSRIDPLHPFVSAEGSLEVGTPAPSRDLLPTLGGEFGEQTLLEMVAWYQRVGLQGDARALLRLAWEEHPPDLRISGGMDGPGRDAGRRFSGNPLLRAWRFFLESGEASSPSDVLRGGPAASGPASPASSPSASPAGSPPAGPVDSLLVGPEPGFSFPYRPESLPVLALARERGRSWVWTYLMALNLWALNRDLEAGSLMDSLGDRPDYGPFYASRAFLLQQSEARDPEGDLRRAVALAPENRILHVYLIRHLQDAGSWTGALDAVTDARNRFPEDFTLDLLRAKALIHLDSPLEAIAILARTKVLPSENGRESHQLWEQGHTLAALAAMEGQGSRPMAEANALLMAAMAWPEHLGQGRPYQPEERLPRFLLGLTETAMGNHEEAREAFQAVVHSTPGLDPLLVSSRDTELARDSGERPPGNGLGRRLTGLDLLAPAALARLGRQAEFEALEGRWGQERSSLMGELRQSLPGRMIIRALKLASTGTYPEPDHGGGQ